MDGGAIYDINLHEEIAYYWAPVWYQETDNTDPKADYITNFNYDGDWIGNNNWENLNSYSLNAYIYYSFVETETHYFIGYYDFHPRDWDIPQHENDLEGVLIVIKKGGTWGQFLCLETEAHNELWQYTDANNAPSNLVTNGHESIDGDVEFEEVTQYNMEFSFASHQHPIIYVDAKGHGVFGANRWEDNDFEGGEGIVYKPKGTAEEPTNGNDRDVSYQLMSIQALWDKRFVTNGEPFDSFGIFDGDDGTDDSAKAPWGWDDPNDGSTYTGELFYNPVDLVNVHFNDLGDFNFHYIFNPYAVIVKFDKYRVMDDRDLGGNDYSDGYFNLFMFDGEGMYEWLGHTDGVLDGDDGTQGIWINENMVTDQWYDISHLRPFHGIHYPEKPYFGIRSKDWDSGSDQWLMDPEKTHWYGSGSSQLIGDDVLHIITPGYKNLDWTKSEVYFDLYIEEEEYITYNSSETKSVMINNVIILISFLFLVVFYQKFKNYLFD